MSYSDRKNVSSLGYLGCGDIDVPQVIRQPRQQFLHVRALLIPGCESVVAETVAHIMQPWLIACAIGTPDIGTPVQASESLLHELDRRGPTTPQDEEGCVTMLQEASVLSSRGALLHHLI
jgi:hypothetical protein